MASLTVSPAFFAARIARVRSDCRNVALLCTSASRIKGYLGWVCAPRKTARVTLVVHPRQFAGEMSRLVPLSVPLKRKWMPERHCSPC